MEIVSLSRQQLHFEAPIFLSFFNQDSFCNDLEKQLLGRLKFIDDEGNVTLNIYRKKSHSDVKLIHI